MKRSRLCLYKPPRTRMDGRVQGEGAGRAEPPHWTGGLARPRPALGGGGNARAEGSGRAALGGRGVSILSLRVCACSPFCGKWGVCARSHEPANAPTSVCLGVWLWVCTQTYGTKPQQTQSARCEFPLKGKPGGWGCSSSSQDVQFQAACSLGRIQGKGQPGPTHESVRVCVCDLGPLLVCRCQAGCPALFLDFLSLCLSQNFRGGGGGGLATCLCVPVSSEAWEGLSLHCSPVRLVAGPLGCPSVCM